MADIPLQCHCGSVKGLVKNAAADSGNRIVCCCSDCQEFARYLKRGDDVLDQFGGTEIYQTSQAQVSIQQGAEQLRSVKMTPKGLIRWYTHCCNTPIGNTMNASMPFVGLIHSFINPKNTDKQLGPVRAYVQCQYALGEPDYPHSAKKFPPGITFRIMRKMLVWKLRGMNKPSVFFNEDGKPVYKPALADKSGL